MSKKYEWNETITAAMVGLVSWAAWIYLASALFYGTLQQPTA